MTQPLSLEADFHFEVPDELRDYERLVVIQEADEAGFLPTTHHEINQVLPLIDFSHHAGGAARHLNEILLHQRKAHTDQPEQAERSVAEEYVSYFQSATYGLANLQSLGAVVDEVMNPNVSLPEGLSEAASFDGETDEVSPIEAYPGVAELIRYIDLSGVARIGKNHLPFDPLIKERLRIEDGRRIVSDLYVSTRPDDEVNEHVAVSAEGLSIKLVRIYLWEVLRDQERRQGFWEARLEEALRHTLARPIAERALAHLS